MARRSKALQSLEWMYDLYARFNQKYWGAKLPKDILIQIVPIDRKGYSIDTTIKSNEIEVGCTTTINREAVVLELSEAALADPGYARVVLVHEMIHVALPNETTHGKNFKREALRLSKAGILTDIL